MSNTSKGLAKKGSKYWMQIVINSELKLKLNTLLKDDINWLCPLKSKNNYSEYELRQEEIVSEIKIDKNNYSFWPSRQPQWDAIGISSNKKTLYLVEAKAHLKELKSSLSAKNEDSIVCIKEAMKKIFNEKYNKGNFNKWCEGYYQLGNRITFLEELNKISCKTGLKVKLVLLNFVNDYTYIPTSIEEREEHYKDVFMEMLGKEEAPDDTLVLNFDVK